MSPDPRAMRAQSHSRGKDARHVAHGPSPEDAHIVVYFRRHAEDDPTQSMPGREALLSWPKTIRARMRILLVQVATSPPRKFSGGGKWEAMGGAMTGWFQAKADGPGRRHYRLFCRLDYDAKDHEKPLLVVVAGLDKPFKTEFPESSYARVRELGEEYLSRNPRSLA